MKDLIRSQGEVITSQREHIAELEAQIAAYKDKVSTRVVSQHFSPKTFLLPQLNEMFMTSQAELEQTAQRLETTSHHLATIKVRVFTTDIHCFFYG